MIKKKITIITINKNNSVGLKKTIKSVIQQKKIYEFIVIDGKSNDGSLKIIRKYKKHITKFVSEKDLNISDAFNKGIKLAESRWLFFLNSGDFFYNKNVLRLIENDLVHLILNDLLVYKLIFKGQRKNQIFGGEKTNLNKMVYYNTIPHQSLIMKKSLFKRFGLYSLDFPIAQDYEFLLRIYGKIKILKLNKFLSVMTYGGITENSPIKCLIAFLKAQNKNKTNIILINYLVFIIGILKIILKKILRINVLKFSR